MKRSSAADWNKNLETIVQWSPFSSEADLLRQDIQIRGVNRDEKKIQMAKQFPNSKHFLTYRHSLRSYASILYLRIPPSFRIILRGKDLEHHNIVNDMMLSQEITYRPQPGSDGVPRDSNIVAVVTIGFVKDAKAHIDVQGFNVYHKNRLIKPFWRLWNATGSDGRGVIGVLEANFVEPAHDKQGFERTTVLSRLEARLIQMQKTYWSTYCHRIGYAPRRNKHCDAIEISLLRIIILEHHLYLKRKHTNSTGKISISGSDKQRSHLRETDKTCGNGHVYTKEGNRTVSFAKSGKGPSSSETSSPLEEDASANEMQTPLPERQANGHSRKGDDVSENGCSSNTNLNVFNQLKEENQQLRERLKRKEEEILGDVLRDLQSERDRCKSLEAEVDKAKQKIEDLNKEQESLIDIFSEERERRDLEEENLRKKLKDASNTIQELLDKVKLLEKMKSPRRRFGHRSLELSPVDLSARHRKLLGSAVTKVEPKRIWGDKCSKSDIVITQGPASPLPNGIPTYTVEIMNACVSGCAISGVHLSCGWFSSTSLINPHIFKRLRFNDCLVNDGKPLVKRPHHLLQVRQHLPLPSLCLFRCLLTCYC
ncbi:histidine kinase-, DNA gyrase B-, and HSP90-like ATPase family protein [Actinidia rufa]|uniref:Histidine kinase-, DNA gyrase B-, and HSP90-like ATPase family protein n=1 Tax=Actinidia rufa TaxID=165716 RepID=A0A7J0FYZ6_9ERIC|nr:histidine kinase-, DNA gyrase B-, and HSP90-like ATPase family protein [Actinidia rufa]